jgi:alpha-1,2-mannosyltransferase
VRAAIIAILLGLMAAATVLSVAALPFYHQRLHDLTLPLITAGLWAVFALAFFLLRRAKARAAVILILAGAVALGGAAMAGPPNTSTDSARYAWDGIVQDAGISPYKYVPTSSHLEQLRTPWLFPAPVENAKGNLVCEGSRIMTSHDPATGAVVCTAMNRGKTHTIYPPSSELLFAGIRLIVGPGPAYWPMQLAGLLMSLGITVILVWWLRKREMDVRWAALWAWCPLVATEAITNSHVDTLGALLLLVATLAISAGRFWAGGIALGGAIAAKLIPVIGVPAIIRRQSWKIIVASVATFLLLYVPYVAQSGIKVLGYLPGYLNEEGYDNGSRFALITTFVKGTPALVIAIVLIAVVAILVWRKTSLTSPWVGQVVMIGATLLIVSPRYPWYALLLVPMIAMSGRWEWLTIPVALTLSTFEPYIAVTRWADFVALLAIVAVSIVRAGPGWMSALRRELWHPFRAPQPELRP